MRPSNLSRMQPRRAGTVLLAGAAYVLIGIGTAMLAGMASSSAALKGWRLAAWLLSLVVFCVHFAVERNRDAPRVSVAEHVALAVAIGAFGVAVLGPLRMHWGEAARLKLVMLSLVAWPILTGVPAFVVALLGGILLDRLTPGTQASRSHVG
jgi:hypothetical protein